MLEIAYMTTTTPRSQKIPKWAKALRERREYLGKSQEQIAADAGDLFVQRTLSALENGDTPLEKLGLARAAALARALNLTLVGLEKLTGLDFNAAPNDENKTLPKLESFRVPYPNEKYDIANSSNEAIARDIVEDPDFEWYPVYSFASASLDATLGSEPFIVDYRRIEKKRMPNGYTLFRVQGDSMQPTVYDGEDMRVDTNNNKLSDDDIYLLAIPHGQVCVKRVRYLDDEWWMFSDHSDQKMYRPQKIPEGTVIRGHCETKFPVEQPMR